MHSCANVTLLFLETEGLCADSIVTCLMLPLDWRLPKYWIDPFHPMTSLCLTSNSHWVRTFANVSPLCCFVSIRIMSIESGYICYLNQCYFIPTWFVLDVIKGTLLFDNFWVPTLSFYNIDTLETVFKRMFIISPSSNINLLAATSSVRKHASFI